MGLVKSPYFDLEIKVKNTLPLFEEMLDKIQGIGITVHKDITMETNKFSIKKGKFI